MLLQIISDLHLEFPSNRLWLKYNPIIPKGDVLLMAGDVHNSNTVDEMKLFLSGFYRNFRLVLLVFGNHEFYQGCLDHVYPEYKEKIFNNVIRLNNSTYIFDGIRFIVSTLWSDIPEHERFTVSAMMNDYNCITKTNKEGKLSLISVDDTNELHKQSLNYLLKELEKDYEGKTVIMTHHLPSFKCIDRRFRNSPVKTAFASQLDYIMTEYPGIDLWVHGHDHRHNIEKINNTILVRNPLGYVDYNEEKDFNRSFCLNIK